MFIAISRPIAKIGKTRINAGFRITKKNWYYMLIALFVYWMLMLCVYMVVFAGWCIYAICYGLWWCIKKIIKLISEAIRKRKQKD